MFSWLWKANPEPIGQDLQSLEKLFDTKWHGGASTGADVTLIEPIRGPQQAVTSNHVTRPSVPEEEETSEVRWRQPYCGKESALFENAIQKQALSLGLPCGQRLCGVPTREVIALVKRPLSFEELEAKYLQLREKAAAGPLTRGQEDTLDALNLRLCEIKQAEPGYWYRQYDNAFAEWRRQIRVAEARRELVAETRLEFMCVKRGVVKPKVVVGGFEHLRTLHPVHHPEE